MPRIVPCRREHVDAVLELLHDAGLPGEGVLDNLRAFWVAQAGAEVVGAVGLESYGRAAVLRSLVVREDRRRSGLGAALVRRVIREARGRGVREVLLRTETAAEFFHRHGFEPMAPEEVPGEVRESAGFHAAEPGRARCMRLRLGDG